MCSIQKRTHGTKKKQIPSYPPTVLSMKNNNITILGVPLPKLFPSYLLKVTYKSH